MFDLCSSNYREKFCKQKITGKEQSNCPHIKTNFPDCRSVISTPCRWKIITINRCNDNHKAFKPHTYVHKNTHKESNRQISSHFSKPEYLWGQNIASHHDPVCPSIRAV